MKLFIFRRYVKHVISFALVGLLGLVNVSHSQSTSPKVVLIGIDAGEWSVINPLIEEGKLPTFKKLIDTGYSGGLKTILPISSPVVWTTIATGLSPQKHQITGYTNEISLLHISDRGVPAIWDILSYYKKKVGVISWLAFWPAEKVNGVSVVDYLYMVPRQGKPQIEKAVYPDKYNAEVYKQLIAPNQLTSPQLSKFVQPPSDLTMDVLLKKYPREFDEIRWAYAQDESVTNCSIDLYKKIKTDFFTFYLRGVDSVCHKFWYFSRFNKNKVPWIYPEEEYKVFSPVIEQYYIYTDSLLNRFLKNLDKNTIVVIISDHGFGAEEHGDITTAHTDTGIIIVSSPYNKKKKEISNAHVTDITPTILAMMGIPLDRVMDGKPLEDIISPLFLKTHPVKYIESYKKLGLGRMEYVPKKSPVDEEVKERLRSLGYIQ